MEKINLNKETMEAEKTTEQIELEKLTKNSERLSRNAAEFERLSQSKTWSSAIKKEIFTFKGVVHDNFDTLMYGSIIAGATAATTIELGAPLWSAILLGASNGLAVTHLLEKIKNKKDEDD
ncbi:hypothetical protein M1513_01330 [Patescibacteria group bacterium]|nr:hypothetical protein [Patescibacteria group bacterium]MCL5733057.1 hypothetical protein [Patescibacteria group bacterium]